MRSAMCVILIFGSACTKAEEATKKEEATSKEEPLQGASEGVSCPLFVEGARFEVTNAPDGIVVKVTHDDARAIENIRTLAARKAKNAPRRAGTPEHGGRCPIIIDDTHVSAVNVEGGSEMTIRPVDPARLDALREDVNARVSVLRKRGIPRKSAKPR